MIDKDELREDLRKEIAIAYNETVEEVTEMLQNRDPDAKLNLREQAIIMGLVSEIVALRKTIDEIIRLLKTNKP